MTGNRHFHNQPPEENMGWASKCSNPKDALALWVQAETLYYVRKLVTHMATFDEALTELDGKIDQIIAKFASDDAAVKAAQQEAADAKAQADAVIADDAAGDAAQDQARADALGAVGSKIDAVLAAPSDGGTETPPADEDPVVTPPENTEPVIEDPAQPDVEAS